MKTERRLAKEREVIMRRKRIAAWLLCAALMLGLLPATVWADPYTSMPGAEDIEGFSGKTIVQFVCEDDENHTIGYGLDSGRISWQSNPQIADKCTLVLHVYDYRDQYLKDSPNNHHVLREDMRYAYIDLTWSEGKQKWVPDDPDQLPVTFHVEEIPDIYEGDAYLSMLDEKPVRFVPAQEGDPHETVYCSRGMTSYWRYSNSHRAVIFEAKDYLNQLNDACGGQHKLVGDTTGKIDLNYVKTEKKWKADNTWVEFRFTCNRAELPTLERLDALLGNVTVRCADGCTARTCRLRDTASYYAKFTGDDSCQVTVYHAAFVKRFCESSGGQQHIFAPGQSSRTELTLTRGATGEWTLDSDSQNTLPFTVQASCRQPAAPTEKELDGLGNAVLVRYSEVDQWLCAQYELEPRTYGYEYKEPGDTSASRSTVASSDDLTRWEYRIWLDNTWPYREQYNEYILSHIKDGNADAYHALISVQPRISLVYDNGWRVATPLSRDNWDGRAYIMLTQAYSDPLDLNGDNDNSIGDMACLYTWLTTGENPGKLADKEFEDKADLNHDGTVDIYDLQMLYEHINGIR